MDGKDVEKRVSLASETIMSKRDESVKESFNVSSSEAALRSKDDALGGSSAFAQKSEEENSEDISVDLSEISE